ncbi:hypothetical protein BsWGS_06424 [Bradybaena similaris]
MLAVHAVCFGLIQSVPRYPLFLSGVMPLCRQVCNLCQPCQMECCCFPPRELIHNASPTARHSVIFCSHMSVDCSLFMAISNMAQSQSQRCGRMSHSNCWLLAAQATLCEKVHSPVTQDKPLHTFCFQVSVSYGVFMAIANMAQNHI